MKKYKEKTHIGIVIQIDDILEREKNIDPIFSIV